MKHQKRKRLLSIALILAMMLNLLPNSLTAYAKEATEHTHTESCYAQEGDLLCTLEESDRHMHTEDCYCAGSEYICGMEESEGHTHGESCYPNELEIATASNIPSDEPICGLTESEGHRHNENCVCPGGELICELEESEGHAHDEDCYASGGEVICGYKTTVNLSSENIALPNEDDSDLQAVLQTYPVSTEEEFRTAIDEINQASEGRYVISLDNDIYITGDVGMTLTANHTTILGNGHTLYWDGISNKDSQSSMFVISGEDTVLSLGASDGSDTLTIDGQEINGAKSLIIANEGTTINIYDGIVIEKAYRIADAGAISLSKAVLNFNGGTIYDCRSFGFEGNTTGTNGSYAGAIYAKDSQININGGTLEYNHGYYYGSIYAVDTDIVMRDGLITGHKAGNHGASFRPIYVEGGSLKIYGGEISNNHNRAITVKNAKVLIEDGTFTKNNYTFNIPNSSGGNTNLIYISGSQSEFVIKGGTFSYNSSGTQQGGVIYAEGIKLFEIRGGNFSNNSGYGGVFALRNMPASNSSATIYDGTFADNTGGVGFIFQSSLDVQGGTYKDNIGIYGNIGSSTATTGGVFTLSTNGIVNLYDGQFTNNYARMYGGVIYASSGKANIYGGTYKENEAFTSGGFLYGHKSTIKIEGGTITDNKAPQGGAIYTFNSDISIGNDVKLYNNSTTSKDDIRYYGDDISFYVTDNNVNTLSLNQNFHGALLKECQHHIVDWCIDGYLDNELTYRWNAHNADKPYYYEKVSDNEIQTSIALKAAHALMGDVSVSKTVDGNAGENDKAFSFTMTLSNPYIQGTYGDLCFENGVAEFTLKHGETKTARDLPADIGYTVTEKDYSADGYVTVKSGDTGAIIANATATATFTNTKNVVTPPSPPNPPVNDNETGSLKISKTVSGNAASTTQEFTFTVTLDDTSINGIYGDMEFKNGVATFTLKHGESRTATNLQKGLAYIVSESENNGYTVTVNNTDDTKAFGNIIANETAIIAFNNQKSSNGDGGGSTPSTPNPAIVILKATKTLDDKMPADNCFAFTLKDENGTTLQMKHNHNGEITFDPLSFSSAGNFRYTISEVCGTNNDIQYDETVYTVMIKVTKPGDYTAAVTYKKDGQDYIGIPLFTNITITTKEPDRPTPPDESNTPDTPEMPHSPDPPKTPSEPMKPEPRLDDVPRTGDDFNVGLWFSLLGISMMVMLLSYRQRKLCIRKYQK